MFVRDWMTSPAVTLPVETRVVDALELMAVRKIRRLPILEDGRLVGILAESDLRSAVGPDEHSPRRRGTRLGDIMIRGVLTAGPDEPLVEVARRMLRRGVSGLPVVEEGRVVGLITESDVFEAFTRVMEGARAQRTESEAGA